MDTLQKIIRLMEEKQVEQQELARYLGINKQAITDWKSGKSKSYQKYLGRIAEFFNVSSDYLLDIQESEAKAQNSTERKLLLLARKAADIPENQREEIIKLFENTIDIYLKAKGKSEED